MWPFSKVPKSNLAQYAATRPAAPCGNQAKHVFWTELQHLTCPICSGIAARELEQKDAARQKALEAEQQDLLAAKVADAVFKKLISSGYAVNPEVALAWACWLDGENPNSDKPQICAYEPLAYRQRIPLFARQPPADIVK